MDSKTKSTNNFLITILISGVVIVLIAVGMCAYFYSVYAREQARDKAAQEQAMGSQQKPQKEVDQNSKSKNETERAQKEPAKTKKVPQKSQNTVPFNEDLPVGKAMPRTGVPMWIVIFCSADNRPAADAYASENLLPHLDEEITFGVDSSSHYEGLNGGYWICFNATQSKADAEAEVAWWRKQTNLKPYMKKVTQLCSDTVYTY